MSISFDRVSNIYDATRGFPPGVSEQIADYILDLVSATPDTQFFEAGIGTGRIALPILQRGYAYTGVDVSEKMMTELRRKLQGADHRLKLLQADVTSLPFVDDSFDVALAVHVLHLIPNWQQALAEIRRVLKPSGVFLYTDGRNRSLDIEDAQNNHGRSEFDQQWRSLLVHYGFQHSDYGATRAEVLDSLRKQGATVETVTAAQWDTEWTVGELLNRYQGRMYSSCWQIPEDVFSQAIADLTDWCLQHYGSLEAEVSHKTHFTLTVVRNWAC